MANMENQAFLTYNVRSVVSDRMQERALKCGRMYQEQDEEDSINMSKVICEEIGRLTTLAIHVTCGNKQLSDLLPTDSLREFTEYAAAYGTLVLVPSGDIYIPGIDCLVTNSEFTACVFFDRYAKSEQGTKYYYTRLEYHRFEGGVYKISNRARVSRSENGSGDEIPLSRTDWADLSEETTVEGISKPLFAVLQSPGVNNIDLRSPCGLPAFSNVLYELGTLDTAYFKNAEEISDSGRIVLLDSDRLMPAGAQVKNLARSARDRIKNMRLPKYVRAVFGTGRDDVYHEINPALNTQIRLQGIDHELSQIGFKCGFSAGYFVIDQKTGMITATQVESDDRRTIQLIKDWRDKLQQAIEDLVQAIAVLNGVQAYELTFDFGDITYNVEQDRARWWTYVQNGYVPAYMFFMKWEGMSEEEARKMTEEAKASQQAGVQLFGGIE